MFMAATLTLCLLLLFFILFLLSCSASSCPTHQRQSLLHFKSLLLNATSPHSIYTSMSVLESWNSTSDCCHWDRVTCSSTPPSLVYHLQLDSLVPLLSQDSPRPLLVSSLVLAPLFHITSLTLLDVSSNRLQGPIPAQGLANLTHLHVFDW